MHGLLVNSAFLDVFFFYKKHQLPNVDVSDTKNIRTNHICILIFMMAWFGIVCGRAKIHCKVRLV